MLSWQDAIRDPLDEWIALTVAAAVEPYEAALARLTADNADLRAQLAALHPAMLTGTSVAEPIPGGRHVAAARVFIDGGAPTTLRYVPQYRQALTLGARTVLVSSHSMTAAQIWACARTATADNVAVYWCHRHEAEHPDKGNDPVKVMAEWATIGPAIREAGAIPVSIIMRNTFMRGGDWRAWFPAGNVDAFGADSYNIGNKARLYAAVENQLDPIIAAAAEVDLPWLIGETGAPVFTTAEARAVWAAELRAYAEEHGAAMLLWWNQSGGMDFRLDEAAAAAWLD